MRHALIEAAAALAVRGTSEQFPGGARLIDRLGLKGRAIASNRALLTRELSARTFRLASLRELMRLVDDAAISDLVSAQFAGDRSLEQERLAEIAILLAHRGMTDVALRWMSRAEQIAYEFGDTRERATVAGDLGLIKYLAGEYDEAVQDLSRARDLFAASNDDAGISKVEAHLGIVALAKGQLGEARTRLESALDRIPEDHLTDRAMVQLALSETEFASRHPTEASGHLENARQLALTANDKDLLSTVSFNDGQLHHFAGDFGRAVEDFILAASGFWEGARWPQYAQAIGNAGISAAYAGNLTLAATLLRDSLQCFISLGDQRGVAQAQLNLGVILMQQGRYDEARQHIDRALANFQRVGHVVGIAKASEAMTLVAARPVGADEQNEGVTSETATVGTTRKHVSAPRRSMTKK
jgi:tetratricopeptide (TPR) repeat protein